MENYEVKGVSQASEIKKAYEEAVKLNAPKYRAISNSKLYYGWDEKTNKHIRAEIGQEWFDNPHYVEPIEEVVEEPIEEIEEVAEEVTEKEVDYKSLYESLQQVVTDTQAHNDYLTEQYKLLQAELNTYKERLYNFKNAFEELTKF